MLGVASRFATAPKSNPLAALQCITRNFGSQGSLAAGTRSSPVAAPAVASLNPLGQEIQKRNAGVSTLGCAIALVAVGGCAQGMGSLFAALIVGMARNPAERENLFTYTLIGVGFVELLAIVVIVFAVVLLSAE